MDNVYGMRLKLKDGNTKTIYVMQVLTSVNRWEKGQRGGINESTGGQGSMYAPVMMGLVYNHNIKKRR